MGKGDGCSIPNETLVNWDTATSGYDRDLRTRGSAERTRHAYAVDLGAFTAWATALHLAPGAPPHRTAPRSAAARPLAAIRGLFDFLVRTEQVGGNPAELVSSPKRPQKLPNVMTSEQMRALLE